MNDSKDNDLEIRNIEPEFHLVFENNDDEKEIQEIIKKRNKILVSLGFSFDEQGNLLSQNRQMNDGIIGFAVADALGVPYEFSSREYINQIIVNDMIGYGHHNVPEGTWSDDTSMLLATMDSIIESNVIDYYDIMFKFSEWFDYAKYTATENVFDIGITTKRAIFNFKRHDNPIECGGFDINDNGNGSLMRILPIVYYLHDKEFTDAEKTEIIDNVSSLTHAHEISCLGCKIFSDYVSQLLNGVDKYKALEFVKNQNYGQYYSSYVIEEYKRILIDDIYKFSREEIKSSGYVIDTLEACLWSFINSNDYENAVITAIKLGGDTDTIAALTGALSGIVYGREQIPKRWLSKLKNIDYLDSLTNQFVDSLRGIVWHKQK